MNKRNKIIVGATILFALLLMFLCFGNSIKMLANKEPAIIISNNTNQIIEGLRIKYTTSNKEIEIPQIKPNNSYKYVISVDADDSINLIYIDKLGKQQKISVTPYITKGMTDTYKINIKSNNNGDIMIDKY